MRNTLAIDGHVRIPSIESMPLGKKVGHALVRPLGKAPRVEIAHSREQGLKVHVQKDCDAV